MDYRPLGRTGLKVSAMSIGSAAIGQQYGPVTAAQAAECVHAAIYAASGNPLIGQSAQLHWVHLRRVMGAVLQSSRQREPIWDEHAAIAAAIAAGDADKAARLIQLHSRGASEHLVARLVHVLEPTSAKGIR